MDVVLEPWGDSVPLAQGEEVLLTVTHPGDGDLEIHCGDDHLTIFGAPGSIVSPSQPP